MKILQINKYYYKKGGAETVFFNTIQLLEEHGHTVIPFSLKHVRNQPSSYESYFVDYPELSESNFFTKVRHLPDFIYNKEAARKLEKLIIDKKPDVAHIHLMFNSLSVSILPVLQKHKIPTIMSVHDYRLVCPAYTFRDGNGNICERCKTGNYYNCIINKCSTGNMMNSLMLCVDSYFHKYFYAPIKYIDHFLFVSKFSREKHIQIEKHFEEKSSYLYNFTPSVKNYGVTQGKYILYFGRMSEEKGIATLLEVAKQNPQIMFKFAGTGPLLEQFKKQSSTNTDFLGFIQGESLRKLIQEASFVVVPSECYENNPMTIIESFMIGTPVIGSNIGGIPELISNGQTGYIFTPRSTEDLNIVIQKAITLSEKEYAEMSTKARAFALENFSQESHYRELMKVYQYVVQCK